jgi:hypothetical protein
VIPIPVETDAMLAILNLPKEMSNNGIFKEHQGLVMEMIHSLVCIADLPDNPHLVEDQ